MFTTLTGATVLLLLAAGGAARAQVPHPDPLAPPTQTIWCVPERTPPESSFVAFRVMERDSVLSRLTLAAYQPDGVPLFAAIYAEAPPRDDTLRATAARLDFVKATGMRFETRGGAIDSLLPPQKGADGSPLPRGATALSTPDMQRARTLVQWYWERICRPSRRPDTTGRSDMRKPTP